MWVNFLTLLIAIHWLLIDPDYYFFFAGHCNDLPQRATFLWSLQWPASTTIIMYPITDSISPLNLKINCTSPLLNIFLCEISINSNKFLWFLSIIWSYNLWEYTVFAMILSETHEKNNRSWLVRPLRFQKWQGKVFL